MAERNECCAVFSSGSKSDTVVPFSTAPAAPIIFDFVSNCSTSVVLPAAPWPTRATVLSLSVVYSAIALSPRLF